jgi:hypothetical protein
MWSLGTTQLISLLLAVAAVAALCGFVASTARRKKRRTRGIFLVGFFCGVVAGGVVRGRRSDAVRLAARALSFAASRVRLGLTP